MKALTLTQPWATLVAIGAKRIETRSWETLYRGPLVIHAAKGLGSVGGVRGLRDLCCREPFKSALRAGGIDLDQLDIDVLPLGAIVATCTLLDCVPTHHPGIANEPGKPWFTGARKGIGQHYYEVPPPLDSNEYAFGDYSPGRFAWLLGDIKALPEPIPAKGALGLWNYEGAL
jgi:activating signal cointegrator 1